MAITLTTGSTLSVAKSYEANLAFTAATNANPCELTVSGSTVAVGDYIEVNSGWGLLDKRIVRTGVGTTATKIVLEGIDTSSTAKYPVGAGAAPGGVTYVRRIEHWSQITQVRSISASGGQQQYADVTSIVDVVTRQIPTMRGAVEMTVDVFDDPSLAWYADVIKADEARTPYGMILAFPNGSKTVANAYWSLMRVPTMAQNEALMTQISLSYAAEPVRYAN
jgi:hypothetical protein